MNVQLFRDHREHEQNRVPGFMDAPHEEDHADIYPEEYPHEDDLKYDDGYDDEEYEDAEPEFQMPSAATAGRREVDM
jgi:hypothetical protein